MQPKLVLAAIIGLSSILSNLAFGVTTGGTTDAPSVVPAIELKPAREIVIPSRDRSVPTALGSGLATIGIIVLWRLTRSRQPANSYSPIRRW
jgi:hypothetical protein